MFSRVAQDFPAACSPSVKGMGGSKTERSEGLHLGGVAGGQVNAGWDKEPQRYRMLGGTSTVWRLGPHSLLQSQSPALRTSCAWWPGNQSPCSLYPGSLLVPWDQRW